MHSWPPWVWPARRRGSHPPCRSRGRAGTARDHAHRAVGRAGGAAGHLRVPSRLMCGSSSPVSSTDTPSTLSVPRVFVRFCQPAASKPSRRSSHGLWTTPSAGALPFRPWRPLGLLDQVPGGVAQLGAVVVVGAEDVGARDLHQGAQGVQDLRDALRVGQVVAGVDHEVGAQAGQRAQPALLLALAADHVDVGDLQHAQGRIPEGRTGIVTRRRRNERASKPAA